MTRSVDVVELDRRVNSGEEGPIQPSSALRDEFGNLVWHISFGIGGFHIVQDPLSTTLGNELPAENLAGI